MLEGLAAPPALRHPRLVAFGQLLQLLAGGRVVWTDFLERLPLTLGESAVDRVVPYSLSDEIQQALGAGVEGLIDLLKRRRDPAYDREKQSALLPDERQRVVLWPRRFCPRTLAGTGPLRALVRNALLQTAELDGGLLESWLSRTGGGREMYEKLLGVLAKAFHTALHQPAFSGVGLLVHLAALNSLLAAKERIKAAKVKNLSYARLERAVGMALQACLRQAFDAALVEVGRPPPGTPAHSDLMVCLVSLGPLGFISLPRGELLEDVNLYGLSAEVEQLLAPAYQSELERDNRPQDILAGMLRGALRPGPLRTGLLQHAGVEHLRRLVLDHLLADEDPAVETDRLLGYCWASNSGLLDLMENGALLAQMAAELDGRLRDRQRRQDSWREQQRLLLTLERLRDQGPVWRWPDDEAGPILQALVERFLLLRMDEFAAGPLRQARQRVVDRRQTSAPATLRQEFEAGRLYRVSADDQPLVRARVVHEEAQLFVDLKGYTRRTAMAKELVMAEFLKSEFYEPILEAAKRHHSGAHLVAREHNIELVNLLGDAVAFSGNIVSLVRLAHDIQDIFRDYRRKLLTLAPQDEDRTRRQARARIAERRSAIAAERDERERQLKAVKQEVFRRSGLSLNEMVKQLQQDYREQAEQIQTGYRGLQQQEREATDPARRAQLAARAEAARQAFEQLKEQRERARQRIREVGGEGREALLADLITRRLLEEVRGVEGALRDLQDEERALDEAELEEQHRQGAGLEAGLFIAYGAAAEVITMDDDVWGLQRVAVSERINEAARGTARNLAVQQYLDELLAATRGQAGDGQRELPFRVYIASTGAVRLEPRLGRLLQRATAERDRSLLDRFLAEVDRTIRERFAQDCDGDAGAATIGANDIYNLGEAISAGALDAYLRQTRTSHLFFRLQIRPAELHPDIQRRFLFTDEMITLVVGSELQTEAPEAELFRYVGQVLFRGFEGNRPTPVYEILRPDSPLVRMLRQHHLADWLREARRNPECKLEGLL